MKKRLIFLLIVLFAPIMNVSATTDVEKRQALLETAKAYWRRGNTIQYDTERSHYFTPEDANDDNHRYNVCSSFVSAVYKNALNKDIPNATKSLVEEAAKWQKWCDANCELPVSERAENPSVFTTNEIVTYYDNDKLYDLGNEKLTVMQNFNRVVGNNLQVGDIVVFYINRPTAVTEAIEKAARAWAATNGITVIDDPDDPNYNLNSIISNFKKTEEGKKIGKGGESGHVVVIGSNVVSSGNTVSYDYEIYESQGKGEYKTVSGKKTEVSYGKAGLGIDYDDTDGSVYHHYLSDTALINQLATCNNNSACKLMDDEVREIAIIRPTITNDSLTSSAEFRLTYPDIKITKTVANSTLDMGKIGRNQNQLVPLIDKNLINNGIVNIGNLIYYRITITNAGNANYNITSNQPLVVTEALSPDVSIVSTAPVGITTDASGSFNSKTREITWKITDSSMLEPGDTITLGYSVKVANDYSIIGNNIVSTGTVSTGTDNEEIYNIISAVPNATTTNLVGKNYNSTAANSIINAYNNLKDNNDSGTGIEFIKNVYDTANIYNPIGNLSKITVTHEDKEICTNISYLNAINIKDTNVNKNIVRNLIRSQGASDVKVELSPISSNILNKYYGGIRLLSCNATTCTCNDSPTAKKFSNDDKRRMDTIYTEHFQTGDILIYYNSDDSMTGENGTYAFIYLDDGTNPKGFYGKNKISFNNNEYNENKFPIDPNNTNYKSSDNDSNYNINAKTTNNNKVINNLLFAKDVFVILRPTLIQKTINIFKDSNNLTITKNNNKLYALYKPTGTNTVGNIINLVNPENTNGPYSKRVTNNANTYDTGLVVRDNSDLIRTADKLLIEIENGDKSESGASNEVEYIISVLGDINSNGAINKGDATTIAKRIIDNTTDSWSYELKLAADYNTDGQYKMNDVVKLLIDNNIN